MVKGETGTLSFDARTSVDKGVSTFVLLISSEPFKGSILRKVAFSWSLWS